MKKHEEPVLLRTWRKISSPGVEEWFGKKFLKRDISEIVVYLAIICYALVFSYFTILKYNAFSAYAWDLGIFNQSFWTTIHSGKLFFSTIEQFISPTGVFFGTHFSPILFIVLPFYALTSSPHALLVFQSFILALGAVPLYFFAKDALNNKTAAVAFSLLYLLYAPLQGVNWFDFHVQAFLPLFFFCTFYYLAKEKWPQYFLFVFLSLTVAENVPVTVIFVGLYSFWRFRRPIFSALKARKLKEARLVVPVLTIAIAEAWTLFAGWIRQAYFPFNPVYTQLYKAVDNWSVLGVQGDPSRLPIYLITEPGRALNAFTYDLPIKLIYLFMLFGPLLFLSFRSSIAAITLAWLVPALFSNYAPYYTIGDHFPAYIVVFIFLAAVEALKNGSKPKSNNRLKKFLALPPLSTCIKLLLIVSLMFAVSVSPLSPTMTVLENRFPYFADYHVPIVTKHEQILQEISNMVPANASVLTVNRIFAHFSSRLDAYAYPLDWVILRYNGTELQSYVEGLFQKSQYVMTDDTTDHYTTGLILSRTQGASDYGLRAYGDGVSLFEKNYSGPTLYFDP